MNEARVLAIARSYAECEMERTDVEATVCTRYTNIEGRAEWLVEFEANGQQAFVIRLAVDEHPRSSYAIMVMDDSLHGNLLDLRNAYATLTWL